MTPRGTVLMTGATGFVGVEVLARVLADTDHDVIALVRGEDDAAAQARVDELLTTIVDPGSQPRSGRVRAVAADLESPGLGLSAAVRTQIAGKISAVMHCAASISFTLPIEDARRINVEGTRQVVDIALQARERGVLDRFIHVSTAYVAGDRIGLVSEHDGDVGQGFRNTYERTKLEAEEVVRESGLPAAIVRPSVIVGDSVTGWTQAFNVIYWPLQAFARGLFPTVPADPGACLDIVPVDVVADALLQLLRGPVRGGNFHIVAGDAAATNARLATMAAEAFDAEPPRFVRPGEDARAEQRAGALLPYFRVRCTFDSRRADELLGARPPAIEDYFPSLMRYARDSSWGKEPSPRWDTGTAAEQRAA
ncbi:MAG TPA: SDR family oxidoreductase [Solirubrobacteraceae bacterium]|nr:SDR family oxidoreductase [Solirubrobacteraceae bacterium]